MHVTFCSVPVQGKLPDITVLAEDCEPTNFRMTFYWYASYLLDIYPHQMNTDWSHGHPLIYKVSSPDIQSKKDQCAESWVRVGPGVWVTGPTAWWGLVYASQCRALFYNLIWSVTLSVTHVAWLQSHACMGYGYGVTHMKWTEWRESALHPLWIEELIESGWRCGWDLDMAGDGFVKGKAAERISPGQSLLLIACVTPANDPRSVSRKDWQAFGVSDIYVTNLNYSLFHTIQFCKKKKINWRLHDRVGFQWWTVYRGGHCERGYQ